MPHDELDEGSHVVDTCIREVIDEVVRHNPADPHHLPFIYPFHYPRCMGKWGVSFVGAHPRTRTHTSFMIVQSPTMTDHGGSTHARAGAALTTAMADRDRS